MSPSPAQFPNNTNAYTFIEPQLSDGIEGLGEELEVVKVVEVVMVMVLLSVMVGVVGGAGRDGDGILVGSGGRCWWCRS